MELEKDFYNAVAALLPLLMLTKVVDRHRRQHMRKLDTPEASHDTNKQRTEQYRHRAFLFLAALTEALALLGAAWKHDDTVLNWLLLGMVAFCGIFFTIELALGKLVEE